VAGIAQYRSLRINENTEGFYNLALDHGIAVTAEYYVTFDRFFSFSKLLYGLVSELQFLLG
jgi:hypothetical protein